VVIVGCYFIWAFGEEKSAAFDLSAIHSMGIPTSILEYRKSVPREGSNSGVVYEAAIKSYGQLSSDDRDKFETLFASNGKFPAKWPKEQAVHIDQLLGREATLFRQAGASGWADFGEQPGRLPSLSESDQRWLALRFGVFAILISPSAQKDPGDVAFNQIFYADRVAAAEWSGGLGCFEVGGGIGLDEIVVDHWRQLVNSGSDDPTTLAAASRVLDRLPPLPTLQQITNSEFVSGLWRCDHYPQYSRDSMSQEAELRPLTSTERLESAFGETRLADAKRKKFYVSEWREVYEHLPKNPEDLKGYEDALSKAEKDHPYQWYVDEADQIYYIDPPLEIRTEALASRRMAKVALAILQERLRTGQLPSAMPNLGGDSTDPFSGKPLIYKRKAGGFILYSVGFDGKDDGGRPGGVSKEAPSDVVQEYAAG